MKTRKQIQDLVRTTRSMPKEKPTKDEVMKQIKKQRQKKKGQKVGDKKIKRQDSVKVIDTVKNEVATKRGRKAKQQPRIKPSPKAKSLKISSSKSVKNTKPVAIKSKEVKPVKGKAKNVRSKSVVSTNSQKSDKLDDREKMRKIALENKRKPKDQPQAKSKDQKPAKSKQSNPSINRKNSNVSLDKKSDVPAKNHTKNESKEKQNVKTVIMKGKVPIDQYVTLKKQDYHVLEYNGKVYSATLNQTNVIHNNNKFYIIQILQSDSNSNQCFLFTRWGRVGVHGQNACAGPYPINIAITLYNQKHNQKSKKGDYRQIQLNYCEDEPQKKEQEQKKDNNIQNKPTQQTQSKLPKQVQSLVELIFDINMMKQQMVQIGYNVKKMPLGKLSKQNMKKGYGILKQLYEQIKGQNRKNIIVNLTNDFYSFIPHDFGFSNMANHILDTQPKVKAKIEMLEALAQIKVATTLIDQKSNQSNKIDANYTKLNRKIDPVDRQSHQFKTINDYLHTTHGKHHTAYNLEIVDLFKVESQTENIRYTKDIHNKMLLWHGSRLTNFVGILSQGLRIAPPEAPVTGYMFGKGVYFADMCSKSANYCFTSRDNNTGILLLCQVALGNCNQKFHADYYAANLPDGKHSTKGVGKIQPDPKNAVQLQKGVKIPMGPAIQSDQAIYLRYNEFIVYDIAQIKIKYILRTKFNYTNNFGFGF